MAFTASYATETTVFPSAAKIFRATSGGTVFTQIAYNATAFDLFDDTSVVNDAIYFSLGANQMLPAGLKFNIGTAMAGGYTLVWEYNKWTGTISTKSWELIEDLSDDTNSFTVTGSNSVKFPLQWQPADLAVNGSTMYWVRCRISAVAYTVGAVSFTGTGLNDGTSGGTYSGTGNSATYEVEIDATGTPDTFKWKKGSGSYTTGVAITGAAQTLSDGVTITFAATTGHTLGDKWTITVTSITEGGANKTDVLKYGSGRLTISGTTDLAPGSFTNIYDWLVANKPYISVTKTRDRIFDFTKVALYLSSRVKTTNETVLLGQNSLSNYSVGTNYFDYIESGTKIGNRGYDGSIFIIHGTYNSSIFSFSSNTKFYGSIIKAGKVGGDSHVYPGYIRTEGEIIDSVMEIAPQIFAGTYNNVKISGYFIVMGELSSILNGLTYICSDSHFMYKYGSNLGFTIIGLDWSFIPATGVMVYLYTYGARTDETLNFINPVKPLPVFGDAITPISNDGSAVTNLTAMKVYDDSAGTYTDYTTAASNATADDVPLGGDVGDILYFGSTTYQYAFSLYFVRTGAVNDYVYEWEYYNSTSGWVALAPYYYDGTNNLSDTGYFLGCTSKGTGSGTGVNASLVTVDGVNAYWLRARIVTKGTGSPTATQIRYKYLTGVGGWKMYQKYSFDALVTDTNGDAITGATVKVTYPSGTVAFTETTDASGLIDQQYLINVQYNQDATQVSTYWIKETITTTATLEVSKSGYETYSAEIDITRKQDMTIALKTAGIQTDQEQAIQI